MLLRCFNTRRAKLERLRAEYQAKEKELSYSGQKYGGFPPSAGNISDPVARRYSVLEKLEWNIKELEGNVYPVLEARNELKNSQSEEEREMFLVLEVHFVNGESIADLSLESGIPERTLYRRIVSLRDIVYRKWKEWQK